ncbi:hypothetical protein [Nocardia sp. NPDC051750]
MEFIMGLASAIISLVAVAITAGAGILQSVIGLVVTGSSLIQ